MKLQRKLSSLAGRIGLAILLTSTAALLLATVTFVTIEIQSYKRNLVEHLTVVSQIVATNSTASIHFNDAKTAKLVLKSLEAEPGLIAAGIYFTNGALFTAYGATDASIKHLGEFNTTWQNNSVDKQHQFLGDQLDILFPIELDGELLGHLRLTAELSPMYTKLANYLQTMTWVLLALIAMIFLLSRRLQQRIAAPVEQLADGMRRVSERQDYSLRLVPEGDNEVIRLTEGLNNMLEQIQERDQRLLQHRGNLERTVEERTRDLLIARDEALASRDAAEMASRAKSEFLATMSHEIRTPMNGVLGMTELMLGTSLDRQQHRFAETIQRSADSLLSIINDILDFSKIEAGKLRLDTRPFKLTELVEDTADMLAERAQDKSLELVLALDPDLPRAVNSDPTRLRQILINLIGNAIKFTEKGEIVVKVAVVPGDEIRLRFEVQDTGVGIEPSYRQTIFDAFTQADGSITRHHGGTGLGLAICRQLVELMGGSIGVESTPGSGSSFWFELTLNPAELHEPYVADGLEALQDKRVLIVDDNATNREILHTQVITWGMRNGSAHNGQGALERLRTAAEAGKPYDIALLDWHMPDMDGVEVARALRADPGIPALTLVMLSSAAYDSTLMTDDRVGITSYLTKPVKKSQLRRTLLEAVGQIPEEPVTDLDHMLQPVEFNARILMAEDNPVNQEVGQAMLENLGCEVVLASDGRAAVKAVGEEEFDLVFMDCHMPVLDGFEATRRIRESKKSTERVPIVALTADVMKETKRLCLAAGMDAYLSKPFTMEEIRGVLNKWLPSSTRARGAPDLDSEPAGIENELLDADALARIQRQQRHEKPLILEQSIGAFLENAPQLIDGIHAALAERNMESLRDKAHRFKSSSANLGAPALSDLCKKLEAAGYENRPKDAEALLGQIDAVYERTLTEIREKLGKADQQPIINVAGIH